MVRVRLALLGILVVLGLVFLVGALRGTQFRGGKPFPAADSAGMGPALPSPFVSTDWFLDFFRFFIFAGVIFVAVGLIFSRRFRKQFLYLLFALGIMALLLHYLPLRPGILEREEAPPPSLPSEGTPTSVEPMPQAPRWAPYLAALVVAFVLAVVLGLRLSTALERRRKRDAIREVVQEAFEELRSGAPVSDVVLRCWMRMVEILSKKSGTKDRPSLTAREFAENLRKLGFQHEAIEILTELFEEVRYGRKESEPRRAKAMAALAALEQAYS
jgi:multisubunit Na+/H+ antiporter MnhC subunit